MSSAHACPACGGPVTFAYAADAGTASSAPPAAWSTVCASCRAALVLDVAAGTLAASRASEPLARGASVLALGQRGVHAGRPFTLIGAVQLRHELGGLWTEWVLAYEATGAVGGLESAGPYAWLAEHEGQYDLLREVDLATAPSPRRTADVVPGQALGSPSGAWTVVERGRATIAAIAGEIPGVVEPETKRPYVDLALQGDPALGVATLEFGELGPTGREGPPRFFVGVRLALAALGLTPVAAPVDEGAAPLQCPSCFAALERRLPQSQSIVCAQCRTAVALDGPEGTPRILFAQDKLRFAPSITMGTRAELGALFFARAQGLGAGGPPWPEALSVTVVGHVVRSVVVDGETFYFEEYLLDAGAGAVYWLVQTDGDWFVTRRTDAHRVREAGGGADLDGLAFDLKERNRGTTEQVVGEHPYAPMVGETAELTDYVRPPRMLSKEETPDEVIWTESLAVPRDKVAAAFSVRPSSLRGAPLSIPLTSGGAASSTGSPMKTSQAIFWLIVIIVVLIALAAQCDDGGCHGFGGSGGFSFGK